MTWEPGHSYKITYTDDLGDTTVRVIDVLAHYVSRQGFFYLKAYCHLREDERTFRVDRVEEAEEIPGGTFWSPAMEEQMTAPPSLVESPYAWANRPDPSEIPNRPSKPAPEPRPASLPLADSPYAWANRPDPTEKPAKSPKAAPEPRPTPKPKPAPLPLADSPYAWANRPDPTAGPGTINRPNEEKGTGGLSFSDVGRAIFSLLFIAGFRVLIDPPDFPSKNFAYIPTPPIVRPAPVVPAPVPQPKPSPAPVIPKPVPRPSPRPQNSIILDVSMIGGHRLLTTSSAYGARFYEVPELGIITTTRKAAVAGIRMPQFTRRTGISDPHLLWLYLEADLDGSGRLSFEELEVFQKNVRKRFQYMHNDTALRPDQFVAQGGGDCEDFALFTAGLLRFWGWEPYIASFSPGGGDGTGHALCFSYEAGDFPGAYLHYRLENYTTSDGTVLKNGKYIPIDYDHVGRLSDAVGPNWKLRTVYIPEKIYGLPM